MTFSPQVRPALLSDLATLADMLHDLWPDGSSAEHEMEARDIIEGRPQSTLPLVLLVAELNDQPIGFIEVGLRSHADGCDGMQPVGFIEGWYVIPERRGVGVGALLMTAAEEWLRRQGCKEVASDTWFDNIPSQEAHLALGFEIVDKCVHFRKAL